MHCPDVLWTVQDSEVERSAKSSIRSIRRPLISRICQPTLTPRKQPNLSLQGPLLLPSSRNLDATTSFGFPLVPVLVCVCLLACLPACLPAWCACSTRSTRSTPLHFSTPLHSTPCTPLLLACLPACMLAYTCFICYLAAILCRPSIT